MMHPTTDRIELAERKSILVNALTLEQFVKLNAPICAMYGIAMPEAVVFKLLHEFVINNYHWVTAEHYRIAFEYNASNKLERKVEHFSALSVTFIGDVLTLYRPYRDKVNLAIQKEVNEARNVPKSIESHEADIESVIAEHRELVKRKKYELPFAMSVFIIPLLEKNGTITLDTFTQEEYDECSRIAKKNVLGLHHISKERYKTLDAWRKDKLKEEMTHEFHKQLYKIYLLK